MASSNVTLISICNFWSTHLDLVPVAGAAGYINEPALSICNDAISSLLEEVYDFTFNRKEMPFLVLCPNRQDIQFGGATAFSLGSTATGVGVSLSTNSGISVSGGTVLVKCLDQPRFAVGDTVYMSGVTMSTGTTANYNSTFSDTGSSTSWSGGWVVTAVTTTSFSFTAIAGQANSDAGGAPGITDFGWLTDATYVDMKDTGSPRHISKLEAVSKIQPISDISQPTKICVLADNGDGTIKLRFKNVPDNAWGVFPVYQAKSPLKVALTDDISPFPDQHASVVRQAIGYRMYRYINSPRAEIEFQKLQQEIARVKGGDDRAQSSVHLVPEDGGLSNWNTFPWSY